ncbi:SLBB domain-containing protein [Sphingomonas jatrophae]|uniref:SLBB domain-containing protein n=1 Tax=Sphingomonas jatrophae TaxID=1166337 RepID=UPI0010424E95|nr:SLBB domain-containing protein [Sphingomonas jatrophae]
MEPQSIRPGVPRAGRTRRVLAVTSGWSALAAMVAATPASLYAQSFYQQPDRSTPAGSPLDPYSSQAQAQAQAAVAAQAANASAQQAATRLEPVEITDRESLISQDGDERTSRGSLLRDRRSGEQTATETQTRRPAPPSEFETYVERAIGRALPRFGADLLVPGSRDFATAATATVPPGYILQPGDRIFVGLTGSIEGRIDAEIDTNGRIFIPRVGAIRVAGLPYSGLRDAISAAVGRQYVDFRVVATVTRLRGVRVYVTGFANNPGAYTVSSLSTMVNAVLAAGGPSAGGSFRSVMLYRDGQLVSSFDLYDFIRGGDKSKDVTLQNEDVLFIPAVGPQVAISGSVNSEAIYEAKPGESLDALLRYAGNPGVLADQSRVILNRLSNKDTIGASEVSRQQLASTPVEGGDIVQVLSSGTLTRPLERQSVVVRIEGEVNKPGNYYVPANTRLEQVLAVAGGTTSRAFIYGTKLERQSVQQQQRQSYREALEQFELTLTSAPLTSDTTTDAGVRAQQLAAAQAVLERLRRVEPDGRVVMNVGIADTRLPGELLLENSDRIFIPARPTTVGVFGAVQRPASFLIEGTQPVRVRDYIDRAGGALRAADRGQIFVVRASGDVISAKRGALRSYVYPGDVIFVPVRSQSSSLLSRILQFSSLVFQMGLTAATVVAVSQ